MRLNLGCGFNKLDGYVNVDVEPSCKPDVVHNLEATPWPWPSGSIDEIRAYHVLEHVGQQPVAFIRIIKEIHRILVDGGKLDIVTPHEHHDNYWGDPTHVRPITPAMMALFSKSHCRYAISNGWSSTPLAIYHDIDFDLIHCEFHLDSKWSKQLDTVQAEHRATLQQQIFVAAKERNNVIAEYRMVFRKGASDVEEPRSARSRAPAAG